MSFYLRAGCTVALTALAGLLCASTAHADTTVFNQPTNLDGSDTSQNDTSIGGLGNYATSYDNFSVLNNTNITSLTWVGDYFTGNPATITGFTINFYADNAGVPGTLLQSDAIIGNANETGIGFDNFSNAAFSYSAALPTPFTAFAGTPYWMSIVADLPYPPSWGWELGTGGDGLAYQTYNGFNNSLGNDLAFSLITTDLTTPEPGSFALFAGMGLTGVACLRRRRRPSKSA